MVEVEREGKERGSLKKSSRKKEFCRVLLLLLELHRLLEREQRQIRGHEDVERVVDVLLELRDRLNSRMVPRVVL